MRSGLKISGSSRPTLSVRGLFRREEQETFLNVERRSFRSLPYRDISELTISIAFPPEVLQYRSAVITLPNEIRSGNYKLVGVYGYYLSISRGRSNVAVIVSAPSIRRKILRAERVLSGEPEYRVERLKGSVYFIYIKPGDSSLTLEERAKTQSLRYD